ncbi:hypothetical protein [Enemella sp. A6]|uniref:hypothetical protein n=1 Tax=Enemella sp. A6 TaxID=3440152 RepID=UPI003EBEE7B8
MSALPVHSPSTRFATPRRHLRAVAERTARVSRLPFLLVMASVLGLGLLGLALLNTQLQNQAFEMRQLHREQARLANYEAYLSARIDEAGSPSGLATKASALGMRPNTHSALLVVPDGKVIGEPKPVTGGELPSSVVKPPKPTPPAGTQQPDDKKPAEQKPGEQSQNRAEPPAAQEKTPEQVAAEKVAQQKAAAEKAAQEKAAQQKAAAEKAAKEQQEAQQQAADDAAKVEPTAEQKATQQEARNKAEAERARKAASGEGQ